MPLSNSIGYDGQQIPYSFISAIPVSDASIYSLFGKDKDSQITLEELFTIYDVLEENGYTGSTALTDYMLRYFNENNGYNYASWNELISKHVNIYTELVETGTNGIYEDVPLSKVDELCTKYPNLNDYVMISGYTGELTPDTLVDVQLLWPEEELMAFSYNAFYQDLFSATFGQEECGKLNPNDDGVDFSRTRGIGDYADANSELYQQTNSYFASLENADSLAPGESITFDMKLALDGPGLGNAYQNYDFSFANSIGFTRIDTTYQIVHQYYTSVDGGDYELDGTVVSDPISGTVGDVINAADIEKLLQYGDNEYTYYGDNGSISLVLDASTNLVIIEYHRDYTTPEEPEEPDNPNNPNPPVDPSDPGEDINDPDIPTTGGTDTNTGDDTNSDNNDESIDDGETPLAPATGDTSNLAVVLTVVVMASALAVVVLRKKAHN